MSFTKLEPIKGGIQGCGNCGFVYDTLPMNYLIVVGFGSAYVTRNGKVVYSEDQVNEDESEKFWTVNDAEELAAADPDNDWRIHLMDPLSERHYQRQGVNQWVLYEKGMGFA